MLEVMERPRRKRLSWESRCEIVARIEAGMSPALAAASGGASRATAYRLLRRYQEGGWVALRDRPSTPKRQPRRLRAEAEQAILAARRRTAYGPVRLAGLVAHPPSTIGKVLRRHGCSRLPRPSAVASRCARRYERERPGELLHIDSKQLGRFWQPGKRALGPDAGRPQRNRRIGWQHLHVAIDDPLAACLRRAAADSERSGLRPLRRACGRLVQRARHPDRARPDRQREELPRWRLDRGLPPAAAATPLHPHLPTTHERQGRALHPDAPQRVGLCASIPLELGPSSSTARLPPLVQQPPTAQLDRRPTTDQPRLRPPWSGHLANRATPNQEQRL